MRQILYVAMLLTAALPAHGQEKKDLPEYPLRCKVEVIPKMIRFGDLVFAKITLTNEGDKTVIVPRSLHYGGELDFADCSIRLTQDESEALDWPAAHILNHRTLFWHLRGIQSTFGHSLGPGKSLDIGFRPLWVPIPEFVDTPKARTIKHAVESEPQSFRWKILVHLDGDGHGPLGDPPTKPGGHPNYLPLDGIRLYKLPEHGFATPKFSVDGGQVTIRPRPDEELALLNEWFIQFAETGHGSDWHIGCVFAHPYYAAGSPYKVGPDLYAWYELESTRLTIHCAEQTRQHRAERHEVYDSFFESMKTRTPEVEDRIARTKELEKQLLARADGPDPTISTMMKEFILLRGHLVEVRYARDTAARSKAFDVMLDWVGTAKHRELWREHLDKIVLNPQSHPDVVPRESFGDYRAKLLGKSRRHPADDLQ
jgi:hypothetical protein